MGRFGVGQPARRGEDRRLITGAGRYSDDFDLPGQAHAVFLRSPHAHAAIKAIDTAQAATLPGVLAVITAADVAEIGDLPCRADIANADGTPMVKPPRPVLARGRARHVGEAVAMVIAETRAIARDGAEAIVVDYDPLPAVADTAAARAGDAAQVWEQAPGNVCLRWAMGDAEAAERAFAEAAQVSEIELVNNRIVVNPMEPRAALASHDAETDRSTIYTATQGAHRLRRDLSEVLGIPVERLRVITPEVGGSFGMKIFLYPEQVLALWAAKRLGRPIKWLAERGESFVSDSQGRDHVTHAALALDAEGRILAVKADIVANLGAYLSPFGPAIPTTLNAPMLPGAYRVPVVRATVTGVFTNTVPVDAYRGAGRPEAAYVIERLIDVAARDLGLDPVTLRRRNFVTAAEMPHTTVTGMTYDNGDFPAATEVALERAGWDDFPARRAAARARGRWRGIGMSYYIERCAGIGGEGVRVTVGGDGAVTAFVGTQTGGQGHATAFAQLIGERLGVDFEAITVVQGDTDRVADGDGTGGSRTLVMAGSALVGATDKIVATAKVEAGRLLEAAVADIEFADGVLRIAGTDRSVTLIQVAAALPDGLDESARHDAEAPTYPNGCHVCEVEIDPETGVVSVIGYTVVDDFGAVVNPRLVAGQVHGGIVQGLGQAIFERCVYDPESGQLLTASFMDYCLPRADDLPSIDFSRVFTPCVSNPLDVKGCGEAGAIGAPPAAINAIVDALAHLGVRHVDMPATPEAVWRLIRGVAA